MSEALRLGGGATKGLRASGSKAGLLASATDGWKVNMSFTQSGSRRRAEPLFVVHPIPRLVLASALTPRSGCHVEALGSPSSREAVGSRCA